ncbi:MAG: MauE/DoxX family redox-associated membrane protein [Chthoniobacterales bacterium]
MKIAAALVIRLILGGLFLAAGLSKVGAPLKTLATIYSYQIVVPDWIASTIAYGLPWMEILLGLAMLAGLWLPVTTGWIAAMLAMFALLTMQAWWRDLPIDCGCIDLSTLHPALAALSTPGGATLRNIVLLALCAALLALTKAKNRAP